MWIFFVIKYSFVSKNTLTSVRGFSSTSGVGIHTQKASEKLEKKERLEISVDMNIYVY